MNHSARAYLVFFFTTALGLTGCNKDSDSTPSTTGLIGSWKLTNRQCYCPAAPVPNEKATFTATGFAFYKDNQLTAEGTYASTTGQSFCGSGATVPMLELTYRVPTGTPRKLGVTVTGNTLVIDYGGPCDAPVDTYQRLP